MEGINIPVYMLEGSTENSNKSVFQVRLDEKLEKRNSSNSNERYHHIKSSLRQVESETLAQKETENLPEKTLVGRKN